MKKETKMNNKGFSLVELIIVIAIMAILVGVLSPQLLKYIEKTNVSSDFQLADSVKTAVQIAIMDPTVMNATGYSANLTALATKSELSDANITCVAMSDAIKETLGVTGDLNTLASRVKSATNGGAAVINVTISSTNQVTVEIANTDASAKKGKDGWTPIIVD